MDISALTAIVPAQISFGTTMKYLAIFVAAAIVAGLLFRIMLLPMIVAMAVAFFDIHDGFLPEGELSLIYLIVFCLLYFVGPGKFSIDYLIDRRLRKEVI